MKAPIRVAVTGAAGNIGYALLWRIASGDCFGPDQPVILQLLEVPQVLERLEGTVMELVDSAMPLVHGIVATDDAKKAFDGAKAVFLVGSRPRTADMNRADLIRANGPIFVGQGKALDERAARNVKILVVGNPCNTNALIAMASAPSLPPEAFTAMTRLDQNRAEGQLAAKAGVPVADVKNVVVWGNHSDSMYPDISHATVGGKAVASGFDASWLTGDFVTAVATRGKAVIKARGASSAASAASAAIDHMRDWWQGSNGRLVSMGVASKGWYGVPEKLIYSFPAVCSGGNYEIKTDFTLDAFGQQKLKQNIDELLAEREAVADLL